MTEQEALAAALDRSSGLDQLHPNDAFGAGFHAALAWMRSQGEPVAEVVDEIGVGRRVIFNSYKALYETPLHTKLYAAPQPAIPDGWQLVPKVLTDDMRSAVGDAETHNEAWEAMLAAAPEYNQQEGEKK